MIRRDEYTQLKTLDITFETKKQCWKDKPEQKLYRENPFYGTQNVHQLSKPDQLLTRTGPVWLKLPISLFAYFCILILAFQIFAYFVS